MTKLRVHEYAKQVNKSSKEVIDQLTKLQINVTNHMSTLEKDAVSKLDGVFKMKINAQSSQGPKKLSTKTEDNKGIVRTLEKKKKHHKLALLNQNKILIKEVL